VPAPAAVPTFIEAQCYRYRAHGGSGDDTKTGYRDMDERTAWDAPGPRCVARAST